MSNKLDNVVQSATHLRNLLRLGNVPEQLDLALRQLADLVDIADLKPGEPIFCLRASDRASVRTINFWMQEAEKLGAKEDVTNAVRGGRYREFQEWQDDPKNSLLVKVPT